MFQRVIVLIAVCLAGCSYDSSGAFTCSDEGAELDGRRCISGVWVTIASGQLDAGDVADASDVASGDVAIDARPSDDVDPPSDMTADMPTADASDAAADADASSADMTPDADVCIPESDEEFCARLVAQCGNLDEDDNCGDEREVDCGDCGDDGSCDTNDYTCDCDDGYAFDAALGDCIDVDECSDGTAMCNANATCTNEDGSFTCACDPPFVGDGFDCQTPYPILEESVTMESLDSQFQTPSITAIDDDLYVAFIAVRTSSRDVQSVSGLGLNWTKLGERCNSTNVAEATLEVWTAQGDAVQNGPISISLSANPFATAVSVYRYSNVPAGVGLNLQLANDNGQCSGVSPELSYQVDYMPTWPQSTILVGAFTDVATHSPAPGWTELHELHAVNNLQWVGLATMTAPNVTGQQLIVRGVFNLPVHWISAIVEIEAR